MMNIDSEYTRTADIPVAAATCGGWPAIRSNGVNIESIPKPDAPATTPPAKLSATNP